MNLVIKTVKWKNFFSYGNQFSSLDVESGINLILGKDEGKDRSNGVGKSSAMEAISFALFGKINKTINKKGIVNWKNKKNCVVELTFSLNDNDFLIKRGIKPDFLEIHRNGKLVPQSSNVKDYQAMLEEEILHLDFKTFISVIYSNINSSSSGPILSMSKPEKRAFLERVFGLEKFTELHNKANDKLKLIKEEITKIEQDRKSEEIEISTLRSNINRNQKEVDSESQYSDEQHNLEQDLLNVNHRLEKLHKDYVRACKEKDENEQQIKKLDSTLNKVKSKIESVKSKLKTLKVQHARIKVSEGDIKLLKSLKESLRDKKSVREIELIIFELKGEIEKLTVDLDQETEERHKLDRENSKYDTLRSEAKKKLDRVSRMNHCPTCDQPIQKSYVNEIKKEVDLYTKNMSEVDEKRRIYGNKIEQIKKDVGDIKKSIEKREKELEEIRKTVSEIERLETQLERKKEADYLLKQIKVWNKALERIDTIEPNIEAEKQAIASILSPIEEKIEKYDNTQKRKDSIEERLGVLSDLITEELKQKDRFRRMIKEDQEQIELLESSIILKNKEIRSKEILQDHLNFLKTLCADDKGKKYAISSLMPFLNKLVNEYLSLIGFDFYVVLSDWLDVDIKGPGIHDATFGNLSGGESRSLNLALQLAFMDVAKIQSGVWPNIVMLDEILDSSIDDHGIYQLFGIINKKQQEENLAIYIISHRKEIGVIDEIANKYMVTKHKGFSRIEKIN